MNPFQDITLINKEDSHIIAEQKKQMNDDVVVMLNRVYPDGLSCICGKKIVHMYAHIDSSKHKRFCNKHNINIEIIKPPEKPKKEKKPKGPIGRPRKYNYDKNETPEQKRERNRKYMIKYFDDNDGKREAQNRRVAEFRANNRELCRERVRLCRLRKKEKLKAELESLYKGN